MRPNAVKQKLKAGETVFGCFVRSPDAALVEFMAYQPWDFIVVDAEHGPLEARDVENLVRAAEGRGVTPLVRVPTNLQPIILRYMDTGAHGAVVPWVNSAAEAERAVQSIKYFPRGVRGLAGIRAADYGQTVKLDEYVRQANAETLVVLQVETAEAVKNLDEILRVADVDVIFIGPNDLSHSLGFPGQLQEPRVQEAFTLILERAHARQMPIGIMVGNAQAARQWRERGARFIAIGLEPLLAAAQREYLAAVRQGY